MIGNISQNLWISEVDMQFVSLQSANRSQRYVPSLHETRPVNQVVRCDCLLMTPLCSLVMERRNEGPRSFMWWTEGGSAPSWWIMMKEESWMSCKMQEDVQKSCSFDICSRKQTHESRNMREKHWQLQATAAGPLVLHYFIYILILHKHFYFITFPDRNNDVHLKN